jgi:hypothetical protein
VDGCGAQGGKMIEVRISQAILDFAANSAKAFGQLNNSITKGEGNFAGFVGETIIASYCKARIANTYDYDLLLYNAIEGRDLKIDVKTKRTNAEPRLNYDCSVAAFNTKQQCDWYAFVRVMNDQTRAWILGYLPKGEYYKVARFLKKGEIDPANNFTVQADCYNVAISQLLELPRGTK